MIELDRQTQNVMLAIKALIWAGTLALLAWWGDTSHSEYRRMAVVAFGPFTLLICEWISIFCHELGHVSFGWMAGIRPTTFAVGPVVFVNSHGKWISRVRLLESLVCFGHPPTIAPERPDLQQRMAIEIAGGPVASLALALIAFKILLTVPLSAFGVLWIVPIEMACIAISAALLNLIPFRFAASFSDAALLRKVLSHDFLAEDPQQARKAAINQIEWQPMSACSQVESEPATVPVQPADLKVRLVLSANLAASFPAVYVLPLLNLSDGTRALVHVLLPWIGIATVAWKPQQWTALPSKAKQRACLPVLLWWSNLAAFGYVGWAKLVDSTAVYWLGLTPCVALYIGAHVAEREWRPQLGWQHAGLFLLLTYPYGCGVVKELNCVFDRSAPRVYRAMATENEPCGGRSMAECLHIEAWGPVTETKWVSVPDSVAAKVPYGGTVALVLREGAFGVPWYTVQVFPWDGRPATLKKDFYGRPQ